MLPDVVEHLKEYFPNEAGNILWSLLRVDAVKNGFENRQFAQSLLSGGLVLENWRPGSLARICLYQQEAIYPHIRSDARNLLLGAVSRPPLDRLQAAYPDDALVHLAIAGAWAEELLTIVNQSGWEALRQFLFLDSAAFVDQIFPQVKESLLFLAHQLNDPGALALVLKDHTGDRRILEFLVLCYCSHDFQTDPLNKKMSRFFSDLEPSSRINALKYLQQQDRPELAQSIAERLLESEAQVEEGVSQNLSGLDALQYLARQYSIFTLLSVAGRKTEVDELWKILEAAVLQWNAGLFLQKSQALTNWDGLIHFKQSVEGLRDNAGSMDTLLGEAWALSDQPDFPSMLPVEVTSPFALVQKYRQAIDDQQEEAANRLADDLLDSLRQASQSDDFGRPRFLMSISYHSIVDELLRQNDLQRAETALTILLKSFPGDARLLSQMADLQEKQGHLQEALRYKLLESALCPAGGTILRQLSDYYERNGDATHAYQQMKKLFELEGRLASRDQLKLAELAYTSGHYTSVDQAAAPLLDDVDGKGLALVILGKTRLQQGYFDEAVSFFRQAVEDDPYSPERWVYLVDACRRDPSEERDLLAIIQEGLGYQAESSTLHAELALEYYLRNQISDALDCLEKAVGFAPDTREGAITLGTLMTSMGDVDKAHRYYLDVLGRFDFDPEIMRLAALSAMETEDYSSAERILVALMTRIKPGADDLALYILARLKGQSPIFSDDLAIPVDEMAGLNEKMDEGLQLDPEHLGINLLRAEMKAYLGDFAGAREIFTRLIEHENTSHWKTLGGYGYASMKLGDLHTAMAALQESYAMNPDQPKLEQYLAEVYQMAGLPADAKTFADRLFFRKPHDLKTLLWYADFNAEIGQWEGVVSALINAYHLNPGDPAVMIRLAEGFVRTNRTEDAQHLARLLKSMPDMEAGQYFRLANLMAQMCDWETAVGLLEQTLERGYSPTAHVYFALAAMEQMQDHFDAALSFSQQALKAEPENRYLLIHQADLLYRLDKPQAAFTCLEQVEGSQTMADEIITGNPFFDGLDGDLHLKDWLVEIKDGTGIAIRKGLYLRKLNRYAEALETVKSAYKQTGAEKLLVLLDDLSMRNADLALAKALRKDSRNLRDKSLKQAASILHLRLHLLLGDVEGIKKILADGAVARYNTTEWHCAQCLISQAEHNWDAAMQNYRQARTLWSNKTVLHKQNKMAGLNGYSLAEEMLNDQPYWMWMTAAGLLLWDESLNGFEAAHQIDANHAFIQFGYLKALTLAGEWQMLAKELELEKRKPVYPKGLEETRFFVQGLINHSSGKTQSADVRRWLVRAEILFSGKAVDAKGISEQLQMPEDLEFLAGLLRSEKKFSPAAEIAGKLSRHFTNVWQQALCYLHTDREKAIQLIHGEPDTYTGFPLNLIVLGQAAEKNGDFPGAFQAYRKAVNVWKDEPAWLVHCAELAELCDDPGSTVLHLKKALDLGYRRLETAMKIGRIHQERGEYAKVVDILEPLYRDGSEDFGLLLHLGGAYLELGDTARAFRFAEQAKTLHPKSEQPLSLYARISAFLGQHKAAMEYARKALELKPGDEEILVDLSRYIENAGNGDEAFQLLENVVVSGPAGPTVINEYVRQKRSRSGAASLLPFLENLRDKKQLPDELHEVLAAAFYENNQPDQAEREASAALKVNPASFEMNLMLAEINHRSGQLDLASHYAAQAIQLDPDNLEAYYALADIYRDKNDPVKALEVYNKAIKAKPDAHSPYFKAGLMLRETRNYQEAELMLKQAARLAPDDLNIRRQLSAVIALNMVHQAQEEKTIP